MTVLRRARINEPMECRHCGRWMVSRRGEATCSEQCRTDRRRQQVREGVRRHRERTTGDTE